MHSGSRKNCAPRTISKKSSTCTNRQKWQARTPLASTRRILLNWMRIAILCATAHLQTKPRWQVWPSIGPSPSITSIARTGFKLVIQTHWEIWGPHATQSIILLMLWTKAGMLHGKIWSEATKKFRTWQVNQNAKVRSQEALVIIRGNYLAM